jgi:hypothetical protein
MVETVLFEEATVLSCIDEGGSMIGERRWRFASLRSEKVLRALGGARAPTILTMSDCCWRSSIVLRSYHATKAITHSYSCPTCP